MKQVILHVAYGMNSDEIPNMTDNQLLGAFMMADEMLPSIKPEFHKNIIHNMDLIADETSDRADRAKGRKHVRLMVNLIVMQTITKKRFAQKWDHVGPYRIAK